MKPRGNAADRARAAKISAGLTRYWDTKGRGPGLARMRAAATPGECVFCGEPAKAKSSTPAAVALRQRRGTEKSAATHFDTCGAPECKTAWFRCWRRDAREAARQAAAVAKQLEQFTKEAP